MARSAVQRAMNRRIERIRIDGERQTFSPGESGRKSRGSVAAYAGVAPFGCRAGHTGANGGGYNKDTTPGGLETWAEFKEQTIKYHTKPYHGAETGARPCVRLSSNLSRLQITDVIKVPPDFAWQPKR